jgi:hypothetical protein
LDCFIIKMFGVWILFSKVKIDFIKCMGYTYLFCVCTGYTAEARRRKKDAKGFSASFFV